MRTLGAALAAIGGGLKDIFTPRLLPLTMLCLVVAISLTAGAAWAAFEYLLPLIPDGGWLWTAVNWLAGAGVVVLAIVLAPSVSMLTGGALFDIAAARVERATNAPPGRMVSIGEGIANGARIALPALGLNLIAIPFYFVPVLNLIVFFGLNGILMGREYFSLAAVRRMSWTEAKALRSRNRVSVFLVGLVASIIPFVAPLFGASAMTRLVTALSARSDTPSAS